MTPQKNEKKQNECDGQMEVFSRVCGFYTPLAHWNKGKKEEFSIRKTFKLNKEDDKDSLLTVKD